jgi:ATP-binding cassette subfamily C protein
VAQLEPFVNNLPNGLETVLGERGVRLSGGERQRVSIARALYHNPDVLVFDEATSALDPATEEELTRAIDRFKGRKTLLVIAHRLTTVERADRLVVLCDGGIDAIGSYDALLRSSLAFRALAAVDSAEVGQPG